MWSPRARDHHECRRVSVQAGFGTDEFDCAGRWVGVEAGHDLLAPATAQVQATSSALTVDVPAAVATAEPESQGVVEAVSAALAPLFGSGTGDVPVESPVMWVLPAAARREFESGGSSLTAGTLLRTSADTGQDTGADAMMFSALALAADAPPALIIDGSVATGASPSGVAVSGDKVYVTNQGAGTLTVYNRSDNSVLATVPVGASPSAVVVNSVGTRAYVANSAAGTVSVINTANNSVMTNIKVGVSPSSLALTPDGTRLFVTNGGAGTVTKIDTATNGVTVAAIKVGNGPSSIAVSPDGLYAYVTNSTDNTVSVITLSYNVGENYYGSWYFADGCGGRRGQGVCVEPRRHGLRSFRRRRTR